MVMTRSKTKLLRNENMDRISELPDCLIQHILSFLPTECAVSTTVLSKRWKNLWINLPILDFHHSNEEDSDEEHSVERDSDEKEAIWEAKANMFMDFVDNVLNHRKMLTIPKFCLTCDNAYFDVIRVKEWISAALKCKVEEMHLSVTWPYGMFPIGLFTSESLIKLHIYFLWNEEQYCTLNLQKPIYFPRLKILHLSSVVFEDEILVQQLFSSCPLLEDLCLTDCMWEEMNLIRISAPTLKSFTLDNDSELTSNMEYIELKIDAPNLMSIRYNDDLPVNLVVDNFQSLVDVDFSFANTYEDTFDIDLLSKLITKLSNVQRLRLSVDCGLMKEITRQRLLKVFSSVPNFENLIYLEMKYIQAESILKLLQCTPNLESLVIGRIWSSTLSEDAFTSNLVPRCLLLHLKKVEVRTFGLRDQMQLVKYFLKNASILEVLIIESPRRFISKSEAELERETQAKELLLTYPRASTNCKVKFQVQKY